MLPLNSQNRFCLYVFFNFKRNEIINMKISEHFYFSFRETLFYFLLIYFCFERASVCTLNLYAGGGAEREY